MKKKKLYIIYLLVVTIFAWFHVKGNPQEIKSMEHKVRNYIVVEQKRSESVIKEIKGVYNNKDKYYVVIVVFKDNPQLTLVYGYDFDGKITCLGQMIKQ